MKLLHPLAAVLIVALLASGCSLFKRDLESSNESADAGGAAIAQRDSTAPSEGVTGLEEAGKDSFDWNEKSAPSTDLPLPPREPSEVNAGQTAERSAQAGTNDIWSSSGNGTSPKASQQVTDAMSTNSLVGPTIEPAPTGKPLNQGLGESSTSMGPQPGTTTQPITQTSPLASSGDTGSLSLRSSSSPPPEIVGPSLSIPSMAESNTSPGFHTIREDASQSTSPAPNTLDNLSRDSDRQAANLAHTINPSALSGSGTPNTTHTSPPPATGFQPISSRTDTNPSATDNPSPAGQSPTEPSGNLIAMAPGERTDSDASTSSKPGNPDATSEPLPDAQTLKGQGIQQYKNKQFDQATQSFRQYLSAYPDEDQEIEWRLAQSLYLGNRWGEAEREFDKLRGSPRPEFRADAILKLGMIDQKKGNLDGAREQWRRVVDSYPKTDAAARASKLLAESP